MASYYVRSGAGGAGTGADWANAYTTLTTAVSGKAAGDIFYVSEDHAESTAGAVTIAVTSTQATPSFVYCVDHNGSVPPVSADLRTTATVTTTGANALAFRPSNNGTVYCYGITFSAGSGAVSSGLTIGAANGATTYLDSCTLVKAGTTGTAPAISLGTNTGGYVKLRNTKVQFGATGDAIRPQGRLLWVDTPSAIAGAAFPTTLFSPQTAAGDAIIRGVDLSAIGSSTLVSIADQNQKFSFIDCKLGASAVTSATPTGRGGWVDLIRGDSGATNYRDERYVYEGTQTVETTIVRTGGATDGTTPIAWKIATTANSKWTFPFESQPITIWNDSTSAITTLTFYGTTTGGGVPNNDDIWVEVEYLGSSATPLGSFVTTTKADNLAASVTTNNSADGSAWGGSGAGNGFKIVVPSFTPGMKGPINITIKVAKASSTYYIDPSPTISGVTISRSEIVAPGVYMNETAAASAASGFYRPIGGGFLQ